MIQTGQWFSFCVFSSVLLILQPLFCGVLLLSLKGNELLQDDKVTKQSYLVLRIYYVIQSVLWALSYYKPRATTSPKLAPFSFLALEPVTILWLNKEHSSNPHPFMWWSQVVLPPAPSSHFLQTYKTFNKKLDCPNTNCWQLSEALYWYITDCSFNELSLIHCGWIIFQCRAVQQ